MNHSANSDYVAPPSPLPTTARFPLLKKLSIASLAMMLAAAAILIVLFRQDQIAEHEQLAAQDNQERASHLMRILDAQLYTLVSSSTGRDSQTLLANPYLNEFGHELEELLGPNLLKVKVYNLAGVTVYSSARDEIGGGSKHPDWLRDALHGQTRSHLESRATFAGKAGEMRDVYVSLLYTPLTHDGKLIGAIELYADATPLFQRINTNSMRIAEIVFGIFALLFASLFFAVFRTDRAVLKWQQAIADSENSLRESQLIAGLGTYALDIASGSVQTSDILDRLLGIDQSYPHTLEGWTALLHPDERAALRDYLNAEVLAQRRPFDKEYRILRHNDQAERWMHGLGKLEFDASGKPVRIHGTVQDITAQKEIQQRSQNAELRYKALVQNSVDALYVCDLNGNFVEVSQQACAQLGYTQDELQQLNVKNILPDLDLARRAPAWRALEPGQPYSITGTFRRKDGSLFPVEVRLVALLIDGAKFMMGLAQDISARKLSEEISALNQAIIDKSSDGFYRHDLDGYLQEVNQAYADMMGYARNALVGMHISQLSLTANTPKLVWARVHDTMRNGSLRFETRHRRMNGQTIDFDVSAIALPEAKCIYAFLRDITVHKQAEESLRIAAVAFETHEAILITDADSRIVRVNQAFSEVTGYNAFEVMGKNPRIMSSGRHDKNFYIEMWQQLLHHGTWSGEIWDKRKNGQIYPKWMNITAVKNRQHETTHYVAIFSDITERKRIEEQIHNLAFYDALTKLPNRRLFLDRLQAALSASARRNDHGALLFIDLDRFKVLNDTHGHEYGDLLLIEVGKRLKACVREMDTVARFGGDEFVVLLESVSNDSDDAMRKVSLVAEKIRVALADAYALKEHTHHCSPSIGVSMYHGNDESMEQLLEQADMAMYQVKGCGRNAVSFFDPVMQKNVTMRERLEYDLQHAIALQQLHLHYQVQVDKNNRPLGAEAFVRWLHPEQGTIMPGQFLPIAEESALIHDICHWILESACKQLAVWHKHDQTRDLVLTVNISAKHFGSANFASEVAQLLNEHQVDPSRLKLELSEKIVLSDTNSSMEKIHALKRLGVKLSMDNFATMYSSLSYLKQLSQEQLKIHQEFVQGIASGGNEAQLIRTVVNLAKSLDMEVFAEGVETQEQLQFLMNQDCNAYQGYLIGRPVSIEEFEALLKQL